MKINIINFREIVLYAMRKKRMSRYELAKKTGIDSSQLTRFLKKDNEDLKHMSVFNLQTIFEKLGIGLVLESRLYI